MLEPAVMHLIRVEIVFSVIVAAAPVAALAQNYPWCSNFHDGAGTNCGFSSYEQCMATARGSGGYCAPNNSYVPPHAVVPTDNSKRKRRIRRSR
jgi:hypothetical protein